MELYRTKDEFPILFEEVLIYIESKGFQVKRIHFDSAAEEIGSNVQKLGAHYGFVLDRDLLDRRFALRRFTLTTHQ